MGIGVLHSEAAAVRSSFDAFGVALDGRESAWEVFESNRVQLLSASGCQELGGFVFATAFVGRRGHAGAEIDYDRAMVAACGHYIGYLLDMDGDSTIVPVGFQQHLRDQARMILTEQEVDLVGLQHVGRGYSKDGEFAYAVVAVEKKVLEPQRVTWPSFMAKFRALVMTGAEEADPTLYLEVCAEEEAGLVWEKAVEWMSRRHGAGLRTSLTGGRLNGLSAAWVLGEWHIGDEVLAECSGTELLKLLAARPRDADVLRALVTKTEGEGFRQNAERFRELLPKTDALDIRDQSFAQALELESAEIEQAPVSPPPVLEDSANVRHYFLKWALHSSLSLGEAEGIKIGERARLVMDARGGFQLASRRAGAEDAAHAEGKRLFASRPPDLYGAMKTWFASLETGITVDSSNYLSAALIESGYYATAFCFARQAWIMDPTHPYAGINVLRALHGLQRQREAETFLERFSPPVLDKWGEANFGRLKEWAHESESDGSK